MKGLLTIFLLLTISFSSSAQSNLNVMVDERCMDRLEYRYQEQTAGPALITYSVKPNSSELFLFDIGAESARTVRSLPKGTVSCSNANFSSQIVARINSGSLKLNLIRATSSGYVISTVSIGTYVVRSGSYYTFQSYGFGYAIDTTDLSYEQNLATEGSDAYVFYNGIALYDCHRIYSFKREPDQVCTAKSDYEFLPGLGFLSEKTGMTASEADQNALELYAINGIRTNEYLRNSCSGKKSVANAQKPTDVVMYGTNSPTKPMQKVTVDQDKELANQRVYTPIEYGNKHSKFVGPRAMVNCPEKPGEGYHIVQPGETLNGIARVYGVKIGTLIAWNKLTDPDLLVPCQKIFITPPPGRAKPELDKTTGKVAIATKPGKKSSAKSKRKSSPAPNTYSTATVANVEKKPTADQTISQRVYWDQPADQEGVRYIPQVVYVAVPADKVIDEPQGYQTNSNAAINYGQNAAVKTETETTYRPETYNDKSSMTAKAVEKQEVVNSGIIHVVQEGESLYSIAKMYGYTSDRLRRMNGLPENVILQPGMELSTTDCTCPVPGGSEMQSNNYYAPKNKSTNETNSQTQSEWGGRSTQFQEQEVDRPIIYDNTPSSPKGGFQPVFTNKFIEHTVRENETLGTIANKYNTTVDDIVSINSLEKTETLIAGMRLMVPRR